MLAFLSAACNNDTPAVLFVQRADGVGLTSSQPIEVLADGYYDVIPMVAQVVDEQRLRWSVELYISRQDFLAGRASGTVGLPPGMAGAAFIHGEAGLKATAGTIEITIEQGRVEGKVDVMPKELSATFEGTIRIQCERYSATYPAPEFTSLWCSPGAI